VRCKKTIPKPGQHIKQSVDFGTRQWLTVSLGVKQAMAPRLIERGDVWFVDLHAPSGTVGHEQGGEIRPAIVISENDPRDTQMLIVVPGTTTRSPRTGELRGDHYEVAPNQRNGLSAVTYFMCEQVRAISTLRLDRLVGRLTDNHMFQIEERLIQLMGLE
jgi:mRNA-degrading endonuclease toxin of MazEF toxin-antitoxin module